MVTCQINAHFSFPNIIPHTLRYYYALNMAGIHVSLTTGVHSFWLRLGQITL